MFLEILLVSTLVGGSQFDKAQTMKLSRTFRSSQGEANCTATQEPKSSKMPPVVQKVLGSLRTFSAVTNAMSFKTLKKIISTKNAKRKSIYIMFFIISLGTFPNSQNSVVHNDYEESNSVVKVRVENLHIDDAEVSDFAVEQNEWDVIVTS
ncbi:hypothetical protein RUM43_009493 [Polyplax serrata]|uniref:Uncharacterized protein n=1 Tax=Polyplax serrata TaxID=468196 RepID=A0AAN8S180_POLSC